MPPPSQLKRMLFTALTVLPLTGCSGADERPDHVTTPLIHGADDRLEYFDVGSPDLRARMSQSMVALVPRARIIEQGRAVVLTAPTLGEQEELCQGERFAEQPAAAFCTGVLVDWDLVLTAGHCLRLLALDDFAVVFGYYEPSPGALAPLELRAPTEIVNEALDARGGAQRLDYGWIRLGAPVAPPRRPVPVFVRPPPLTRGDAVISVGTPGGVPLKLDRGGAVRDPREATGDYFSADTDTSHGSSGGAAFDERLSLVGVFVRGGTDSLLTPDDCRREVHDPDDAASEEQFTYVHRAVEALCADELASSICRPDCGNPCQAAPWPVLVAGGGCAMTRDGQGSPWALALGVALSAVRRLRRRCRGSSTTELRAR
jgi:hypothetical protein